MLNLAIAWVGVGDENLSNSAHAVKASLREHKLTLVSPVMGIKFGQISSF